MTASERRDRHALSKKSVKIKERYREDMKEICWILISEGKKERTHAGFDQLKCQMALNNFQSKIRVPFFLLK